LSGVGFSCALQSGWTDDLDSGELVALDVASDPLFLDVRIGFLADRQISEASQKFVVYLETLKANGAFDS